MAKEIAKKNFFQLNILALYIILCASTDHDTSGKYADSNTVKCLLPWLFVSNHSDSYQGNFTY